MRKGLKVMRCINCGWNNPDGIEKCQKCNEPLPVAPKPADPVKQEPEIVKNGQPAICPKCGYPVEEGNAFCPNCGYSLKQQTSVQETYSCKETLRRAADFKPSLPDVPVQEKPQQEPAQASSFAKQTVREWEPQAAPKVQSIKQTIRETFSAKKSNGFSLIPVDAFSNNEPKTFNGDNVMVCRSSLDPQNIVIDEKAQTSFKYENGKWLVRDESGNDSTFILVRRETEIREGDIVVIGNRRYIFK